MNLRIAIVALTLFIPTIVSDSPNPVEACSTVTIESVRAEIASESAIIIWDSQLRVQHFVRRAVFSTPNTGVVSSDFGFLVPTPTQPVIAPVADTVFGEFEAITAQQILRDSSSGCGCSIGCSSGQYLMRAGRDAVEVLEEKRVGAYDAAILRANDAAALASWLRKHNYTMRPAVERWLTPYVQRGWIISAFRIAKDNQSSSHVGTAAVRMSFKTDRPFYPYREPDDVAANNHRLMRVFFVADRKFTGMFESSAEWPGRIVYAKSQNSARFAELIGNLTAKPQTQSKELWLTEYEDRSAIRSIGADVCFVPHADSITVERPVITAERARSETFPTFAIGIGAIAFLYVIYRFAMRSGIAAS